MHVFHTFEDVSRVAHDVYLAIGVFDGLHLGHQRVIGQACDDARAHAGHSVVLTFDPHPMRLLHPDKAPPLLTSTLHKLALISRLGVDACLVLKFDRQLSLLSPEQFLQHVATGTNRLREICVGSRFRFGHNRTGDIELIKAFAATHGFRAREIESVTLGDEIISSTAVRQHILHGRLDRAAGMLGRLFSILGTVEEGDARGRQLGFPTANLNTHNEALPPDGVYVVHARLAGLTHPAVLNIGVRPTFEGGRRHRTVEVHILDLDRNLYGQDMEVEFVKKLRDEQKFAGIEDLRRQLTADVQSARQLFGSGS